MAQPFRSRSPMKRAIVTALCGLVLIVCPARAQDSTKHVDAATAASARKLLAATGATKLMLGNLEAMIASQRQNNPQIPPAFWDAFLVHARRDTTHLLDLLVPIYASHLTQNELEDLLKFYNSPIG